MRELLRACSGMLVVLAVGCCSTAPGGPKAVPPQTTIEVRVDRDCQFADSNQKMIQLDYLPPTSGPYNTQVEWIIDKGPDDTAVITAKGAEYQGNGDKEHGRDIRSMLKGTFVLLPGVGRQLSGRPKHGPPYQDGKSVVWYYSIDIVHGDGEPCHVDPGLCYRTADGTWICSR